MCMASRYRDVNETSHDQRPRRRFLVPDEIETFDLTVTFKPETETSFETLSISHTVTIVTTTAHEWATINRRPFS